MPEHPPSTSPSPVQQGPDGPYMQLQGNDLRLTLWKDTDVNDAVELFNHPDVGKWACLRPYPYGPKDYQFIASILPLHRDLASSFLNVTPPPLGNLESCPMFPLSALRDDQGRVVGSANVGPSQKEVGAWEIAYDLHPSLQGKGIGRIMVQTLIEFTGWLGVKMVVAFCETSNIPSSSLLKKLGFTYVGEKLQQYPEDKGGDVRVIHGFNNLCTGIFPDDGESSSPILKETSAEAAKMNRFQAQLQSRASIPGSKKMKLTGTLFTVSCLYRYPDGENHQLGSYIAEQLGGRTIDIDNELAHLERKNKNKNGSGKARR
ncbi:hypothetical protein I204_06766 [Kwoniella mangroviensis CBS 8886]|nr:hypothetical protein I204_06766 [Kwoniella mangroviensis CBS 8886]